MKKLFHSPYAMIAITFIIIGILALLVFPFAQNSAQDYATETTTKNSTQTYSNRENGIFYAVVTALDTDTISITPGEIDGNSFKPGDGDAWLYLTADLGKNLKVGDIIKYTTDGAKLITAEKQTNITYFPGSQGV